MQTVVNLVRAAGHYLVTGLTAVGHSGGAVWLPVVGWAPAPAFGPPRPMATPAEAHVGAAAPALVAQMPALATAERC